MSLMAALWVTELRLIKKLEEVRKAGETQAKDMLGAFAAQMALVLATAIGQALQFHFANKPNGNAATKPKRGNPK
jgi:hypothetical protein